MFVAAALLAAFTGKADTRAVQIALAALAAITLLAQAISALTARQVAPVTSEIAEIEELQRVRTLAEAESRLRRAVSEMNTSLKGLLGDLEQHDTQLGEHRLGVEQAATLKELHEIEERLLSELDKITDLNASLKQQVITMNKKIINQETELSKLSRLSTIDPLTLVANRGALDKRLAEETDRSKRYNTIFSIIMADIDHFKKVNDSYGHPNGDRLLRAFGKLVDSKTRLSDFVARFGGEEFVVILPATELKMAFYVAEKVRQFFNNTTLRLDKTQLQLSASFGVAQFKDGDTVESLLKRVDDSLYLAKNTGRNKTCTEDDLKSPETESTA